jgi:hypothetical protein
MLPFAPAYTNSPDFANREASACSSRHMVNLRSDQSGLNSPSRKSRLRTAALAAERENHLIQILRKVWPAGPTKLHAHRCPYIARSGRTRSV